jgi:hypothetical protein
MYRPHTGAQLVRGPKQTSRQSALKTAATLPPTRLRPNKTGPRAARYSPSARGEGAARPIHCLVRIQMLHERRRK